MTPLLDFLWLLIPWVIGFFVICYAACRIIGIIAYCIYRFCVGLSNGKDK